MSDEFTSEEFKNHCRQFNVGSSHLKILAFNVCRFFKRVDQFISLLCTTSYSPDVIVLVETWLTLNNKDNASIQGYDSKHIVRENSLSGGVSIFYKESLDAKIVDELCLCNLDIELCGIIFEIDKKEYCVLGVYRPHSGTVEGFTRELNIIFNKEPSFLRKNVILLGDLNVNLLRTEDSQTKVLTNFMRSHYLAPVIKHPTRYDPQPDVSPSLIDHIWINFISNDYKSGSILADLSDHCPIYINIKTTNLRPSFIKISFRDYSERSVEGFISDLLSVTWDFERFDNVSEMFSFFNQTIQNYFHKNFQVKTKMLSTTHINKPWITPAIQESIKTKSQYFKLYKRNVIDRETNNNYKRMLNKIIKKAKSNYYDNYFNNCFSNMKKTWSGIDDLLGRNHSNKNKKIGPIKNNDELVNDEYDIANVFNDHFCSIAQQLDQQIPHTSYTSRVNNNLTSLYLHPVTTGEVSNIISELKNSKSSSDGISTYLLKKAKHVLCSPLTELINWSLSRGEFPDLLKIAHVTPIFKSGDRCEPNNYRPISVLPVVSKVLEKCMYRRVVKFLEKYKLLSHQQYGFTRGKSCVDAVSSLTEFIYKSLNASEYVVTLFIDLKKAYDTVNHTILLDKLYSYGLRGIVYEWFKSYLTNRQQCVKIGKKFSAMRKVMVGVPQGSVLGSLLFLLYINDLPEASSLFHFVLFADDTCLTLANKNYSTLMETFNTELQKVNSWMVTNRLSLNAEKTVAINFSTRMFDSTRELKVNAQTFKFVEFTKYLGVTIDRKLSFRNHIELICSKISRNVGLLYRISLSCPKFIVRRLYYAFILPYMNYCNIIWGGAAKVHLDKLLKLQKRAVRIITGSSYLEHTAPLFKQLEFLKIDEIYRFSCCIHVFKNRNLFQSNSNVYNTRRAGVIKVTFQRLSVCQRSIHFDAAKLFNQLPLEVTQVMKIGIFKRKVKELILSNQLVAHR